MILPFIISRHFLTGQMKPKHDTDTDPLLLALSTVSTFSSSDATSEAHQAVQDRRAGRCQSKLPRGQIHQSRHSAAVAIGHAQSRQCIRRTLESRRHVHSEQPAQRLHDAGQPVVHCRLHCSSSESQQLVALPQEGRHAASSQRRDK